ncbi:MAG TPA: hypothetical protein VGE55_08925 [Limnobacter sp.]|uniref:hypothetical protein n=1 Tax=Limnobacter sp. TaxID=2003368 RepID=UPI002ED790AA
MPLQDATVLILAQLGLKCPQSSVAEATQGFRIEFDNQFFVELHAISPDICRVSSRISRLAKSLETQNRQIEKALSLQQDLGERTPRNVALAISGHDNCLRSVLDLEGGACFADGQVQEEITENLMRQFQAFVHYAYALKSTFVNAAT